MQPGQRAGRQVELQAERQISSRLASRQMYQWPIQTDRQTKVRNTKDGGRAFKSAILALHCCKEAERERKVEVWLRSCPLRTLLS
jgi:hypothetical protein